jgi:hypothetical protein
MNKKFLILLFMFNLFLHSDSIAGTIIQCKLSDGSIEFTNKSCSQSKISNKKYKSQWIKKKRKSLPFKEKNFIHLQNKLLQANTIKEINSHAQKITDKISYHAKRNQLKIAYDMIAATYVKLSKKLKKQQWQEFTVHIPTMKIRNFFEVILISQSTVSNSNEFEQVIKVAWKHYQKK